MKGQPPVIRFLRRLSLHSIYVTTILILTLFIGSVGVGVFVQKNPLIKIFDEDVYEAINKMPHPWILNEIIKPFNKNFLPWGDMPSYYYPMLALILAYLLIVEPSLFAWALGCFVFGTFLAGLITTLDWHFVFRQRPFELLPSNVDNVSKELWKSWSSYPSGHVRETTLYLTIASNFIKWLKWPAIIFCIFIGFSRIYIGAHFPTDVLAGLAIGYLAGRVTLILARELQILVQEKGAMIRGSKPKSAHHS